MLEGIRAGRAELVSKFATSQRLAVRVGALLTAKVELTAAVLEAARPGSAVETLLLRKEVLAEAATLSTSRLCELAKDARADLELAVEAQDGKRVIGLEEELAAPEEFSKPALPMVAQPLALSPTDVDPLASLMPAVAPNAADLFTGEEVARLRLTVLTGVDPKAKVEALRKLVFAPMAQQEKGLLFLRAVSDEAPEVRAEAAAGLRSLGLDGATAAAVRALSDGTPPERTAAINSLARRADEAGDAERAVVIAALAADLRGQQDPARAVHVLRALATLAPHLVRNADFTSAVLRIAIRRLFASPGDVSDAVVEFLGKIGAASPEMMARLTWSEYVSAPDRRSQALLLTSLARVPQAADPARLAKASVELIAGWSDADFDCRRASGALLALGETGVRALLEALPAAPPAQRPFLIRLADQICEKKDTPDAACDAFGRVLVEMLKTARKPVRIAALDTRCIGPRMSAETRAAFAVQIVTAAHDYNLEELVQASEACLRRIGAPAIPELVKALRTSPYRPEREIALRSLEAILADDRVRSKEAAEALRLMLDLVRAGGFPNPTLLAITAGRLAALSGAPAAAVRGTAMEFRNMLREKPGQFEILDAYAWAVSSRHVEPEQKMSAGLTLLGLLDSKLPEDFVKEDWTHDGLQLTIDKKSSAHTVLVPTLVGGLVRIAMSGAGTDLFLEKIVQGLLAVWKRVVTYEIVWSPGNISELAEGLGRLAARRETPLHLRLDIIEALRVRCVHVPVARALGDALALEEASKRMDSLCAAVANELCELSVHRDFQEMDDRQALLGSLAKIALRKGLSGKLTESEDLRRKIVELLFDALRDGLPEARGHLDRIADGAHVPKILRKTVTERLGRMTA